ncbi:PHD finger protein EHD3-like isoform X2 [Juglans microcarpa x Juglans regia]|uniref:PHD finger protein EHD3-like isoform X2 n=1 Tax=Juglans microcarpa x Juglans regia TaxID=2249226 RepID=UPI001B7EA757|nr:PHD finger protein EHD3-like isoform X2 [Juglans microcarpa x Juglans regia]
MGDEEGTGTGDGTYCVEGLKSEAVNNGSAIGNGNDGGQWNSGGSKSFRTYKRRKYVRSSSDGKAQQDWRVCAEAASQLTEQTLKEPGRTVLEKNSVEEVHLPMDGSDDCSQRHWRNVILEHMYRSSSVDESCIRGCIWKALVSNHGTDGTMVVKESGHCDEDRLKTSQTRCMPNGSQKAANGHAGAISSGCLNESDHNNNTEKCQRALFNILISDKFTSLCKLLFENFQGIKADFFDFSIINLRMKEGTYEHSPVLFSSDIQQVWRKLQEIGSEFVSLAKSLSNMSRTAYHEQVGGRIHSPYEDGEHEFLPRESDSQIKPVQTEDCGVFKFCTCRQCGGKADGRDYLLCDSCEEMYHISCIEPAIKEIPPKSWYCAVCTASRIASPHQNCEVCDRLIAPKSLSNGGDDETSAINEETSIDIEENSNCGMEDGLQPSKGGKNSLPCKICGNEVEDGEKLKACGHSFCPNKYYHARCLTTKQLKSYGPRWYCPSCLCRVCLADQDDDKIILCDGCDHAYHIYCIKPLRTSIPRGKWFCRKCNAGIQAIRRAKRAYETIEIKHRKKVVGGSMPVENLEKRWNDEGEEASEKSGGMDMLLTAAKTLKFEENLGAIEIGL